MKQLKIFFIHCDGQGYWSDLGDFVPELKGATAYTAEDKVNSVAEDLKHSVFTGGAIRVLPASAQIEFLPPSSHS